MHLGGEVSGGGVQPLTVLGLFIGAEVEWALGWVHPPEAAESEGDLYDACGVLHFTNGVECQVFPPTPTGGGVSVWGDEGLVHWQWGAPEVSIGWDERGVRRRMEVQYEETAHPEFGYLHGALRSMIRAVRAETIEDLAVSGYDLCQAVEIAIALRESARLGHTPVLLPLANRTLRLEPVPYRWEGGSVTRGRYPDADGESLQNSPYRSPEGA